MKTRTSVSTISIVVIAVLLAAGCRTTIILEEEYDVRIVNESGERVKMRWDDGSYRYLDDGCIISIPADGGYYELEWETVSSRTRTRPKKIFTIEVEADIDIVFRDDPDIIVIER